MVSESITSALTRRAPTAKIGEYYCMSLDARADFLSIFTMVLDETFC